VLAIATTEPAALAACSPKLRHSMGVLGAFAWVASLPVVACLLAAPWLFQELVPCEWIGLAIPLLLIRRLTGWGGEIAMLVLATGALAIAFHWTPAVLAYSLDTGWGVALLVTIPIILFDAVRLAAPFLFAARCGVDPLQAWLPAGLMAVVVETIMPAVFPWRHGYSQIYWYPLIQSADLFGPAITTLIAFAHAGVVVWMVDAAGLLGRRREEERPGMRYFAWGALVLCGLNAAYGMWAIQAWTALIAEAPAISVALVQANPEDADGIEALQSLTKEECRAGAGVPDLVCWPECSGGSYADRLDSLADPEQVQELSRHPRRGFQPWPDQQCSLLFGGKVFFGHPEKPQMLYQSAILLDSTAGIRGRYHKRHLMPFGEYVPGAKLSPEVARLFPMQEKLTEGAEATVLSTGGPARLGVLLCYEDMIPSAAGSLVKGSANLLVSLINGAAFTAPLTLQQHRLLAQLRAVESRRFLLRCAATGETCVISPLGKVVARLPLQTRGCLRQEVRLLDHQTVFNRLGDWFFPIGCACGLMPFCFPRLLRRKGPAAPIRMEATGAPSLHTTSTEAEL